ncbi:nitric oxide synthase [Collybia nuda]|uniref:nitric-oxide synthase (NADPH) n=1 Tax=Collybia nuda TaxID=64659 RepID=A0A9P5Y7E0_9AGAR|nr:nitric oxide synthase [Collybia nuda]
MTHQCPVLGPDLKGHHGTLMSTGCTEELCAVGQVSHTHEPRVGENRTVEVVEREAEDFLRELYSDKLFASETNFQERLQQARSEIRNGSFGGLIYETQETGIVGGTWTQTPQELEFGIRWAWRNARKCLMRSCCEDLRLCDLRSVKCGNEMAMELVKGLTEAYNGGDVIPTVFAFFPQTTNSRGPMIWNDRILSFAAYETEDGTILGDPENTQLTKDIMELGWAPPQPKSRWDVLPVVVMAKDEEPIFVELPPNLRRLVKIRHPRYEAAFEKLDLKWVAFPAFSRLGFDIGGVQYTAAPFIGWFMDTEIGDRGLADPLRYNVLPDLVKALYFNNPISEPANAFEHLPKYEQLVMLSRAQIELNYAIYYSFLQDGIRISDTLSALKKWIRYNDEFEKKNGYFLPSDPYWLPSSQSSVVPAWHFEGGPGYQSKPLICRGVQDPVTVWRTEKSARTSKNMARSIHGQCYTESLGAEWKTRDITQDGSISATPEDMAEPDPPILGIGAHSNYDDLILGVPLLFDTSQDNIEPHLLSPTDNISPVHRTELDSLASSCDALVGSDTTLESNYSMNVGNPFPPDDANPLSDSWETLVEPMTQLEVISITSVGKSLPSSDVDSLSSHWDPSTELVAKLISSPSTAEDGLSLSYRIELEPWNPLDIVGQQQDSGPLLIPDRPSTPKRPRSNSLSTIDEEIEEYEEEVEGDDEESHGVHVEEKAHDRHNDMRDVDTEGVVQAAPQAREIGLEPECESQESQDIERVEGSTIQTVETNNPKIPVQSRTG